MFVATPWKIKIERRNKMDNLTKLVLKNVMFALLFISAVLCLYYILPISGLFAYILIIMFVKMFVDFWPTFVKKSKSYFITILTLSIIFSIMKFLEGYGLIGFILL